MAIPFNVPSDEYTLDQYRRIHQLLLDLMDILRGFAGLGFVQIPPPASQSNNVGQQGNGEGSLVANVNNNNNNGNNIINESGSSVASSIQVESQSGQNIPDIVASTLNDAAVYFRNLDTEDTVSLAGSISSGGGSSNGDGIGRIQSQGGRRMEATTYSSSEDTAGSSQQRRRSVSSRRACSRIRGKFGKRKKSKYNEMQEHTCAGDGGAGAGTGGGVILHAVHCGWLNNNSSQSSRGGGSGPSACSCMYQFGGQKHILTNKVIAIPGLFPVGYAPDTERRDNDNGGNGNDDGDDNIGIANSASSDPVACHCFPSCLHRRLAFEESLTKNGTADSIKIPSWLQIGEELRKIAESFKSSLAKDSDENKEEAKDSIFSILLPSQLGRTMIATVLIYIGWKLLKRA